MGLRINHNISALNASRQLGINNKALSDSLQKLSSGYRINKGSDDPAGLTISEKLRAQLSGLHQGVENAQNAVNVIGTAEGALNEMNELLRSVRELAVHAANEGTVDDEQLDADQAEIDSAINSINRIANSTKYGDKYLLNGNQAFGTSGVSASDLGSLDIYRAQFGSNDTLTVNYSIDTAAERAQVTNVAGSATNVTGDVTISVSGAYGSEQISIASGTSKTDIVESINALSDNTGVQATTNNDITLQSTEFGEDYTVNFEVLSGTGVLNKEDGSDAGVDVDGSINGADAVGDGQVLTIDNSSFAGKLTLTETAATSGSLEGSFTVNEQGMKFQLGDKTNPNEQESFGIKNVNAYNLGVDNGRLSEVKTGGSYDLKTDPDTAVDIIDEAINDVASLRARLGAFQVNTLETNINSLGVAIENITSSESRIRDVDFAQETASFTKAQILVQAGTSIAAQANLASQSALQLLT